MTAIAASSVRSRTMMDGSLQITVMVEPRHAVDAFVLFSSPGTPMALAALKVGTPIDQTPKPEPEHEPSTEPAKGGPLSKWAALRCQDERFRGFLGARDGVQARNMILDTCGIRSRAELDSNPEAAALFARHFRMPWADHCKRNGWAD